MSSKLFSLYLKKNHAKKIELLFLQCVNIQLLMVLPMIGMHLGSRAIGGAG
jgi:hypothetical protein